MRAAKASGTMTAQMIGLIAMQDAETAGTSCPVAPVTAKARNAPTAPIQPTEDTTWTVSAALRSPGGISWPIGARPVRCSAGNDRKIRRVCVWSRR